MPPNVDFAHAIVRMVSAVGNGLAGSPNQSRQTIRGCAVFHARAFSTMFSARQCRCALTINAGTPIRKILRFNAKRCEAERVTLTESGRTQIARSPQYRGHPCIASARAPTIKKLTFLERSNPVDASKPLLGNWQSLHHGSTQPLNRRKPLRPRRDNQYATLRTSSFAS